ncbi:hypothetical protein COO09_24325 [Rhizorhabdus dicambivorans]|uniref:protein O-GlcNAc transferase n=1 Tax=Rhizorhabdus dicambivorans TaxID=1850238 RepID=A0A2A4FQJ7_9SPHN|nr:hypothetical protein CMV14_13300 [Rhizorhabdus dicambivorans]PCE39671.1 hypothetical protein COO09_24325 [Rhizorhabdus dicambivorans]
MVALYRAGRHGELVERSLALAERYPHHAALFNLIGVAHSALGQLDLAVAAYDRALAIDPGSAETVNNLGVALRRLGRIDAATNCHRRALAIDPNNAAAFNNLGTDLRELGRADEAADCYRRAIELRPGLFEPHRNLGNMLIDAGKGDEAAQCFARALEIRPDDDYSRAQKLHRLAHLCDWNAMAADAPRMAELGLSGSTVSPFTLLALDDSPERHCIRARRYIAERFPLTERFAFTPRAGRPDRLRIGYFSADFHDHATMMLAGGLFERHDRSRFAIHAFSYGPDRNDAARRRLRAAVDSFEDVRALTDMDIAALARQERIDIAVDLKGLTHEGRPGIFAHGAAPVQIGWLGYPGTLGAPLLDYLIVDRWVIPDAQRRHYVEKLIHLPDCYQSNDDRRPIAATPTRSAVGLPEQGFVFACFNVSYKIGPDAFDIWMRLLAEIEDSVLWLLGGEPRAEANLRREAATRGISPDRLVFADPLPNAEHLARLRLADLFLDCFVYNAHTTASDALWAGLPVLTTPGEGFAARVAASLLDAVGLPEMIAPDREAYAATALDLARNPERLAAIRDRLAFGRLTCPLFDTGRFTVHIEAAYDMAHARWSAGLAPADITVAPHGASDAPI